VDIIYSKKCEICSLLLLFSARFCCEIDADPCNLSFCILTLIKFILIYKALFFCRLHISLPPCFFLLPCIVMSNENLYMKVSFRKYI
jgi:hypothetical protein